jgi:hypothetical protein
MAVKRTKRCRRQRWGLACSWTQSLLIDYELLESMLRRTASMFVSLSYQILKQLISSSPHLIKPDLQFAHLLSRRFSIRR